MGTLFDEGPTACPFLALDRDRERRADEPDARHRCYATPAPEPRAIAHQRAYCLTPTFTACPIFQDWAVRAAARPVPLRPIPSMPPPMSEAEMAASLESVAESSMPASAAPRMEQASLFEASEAPVEPAPSDAAFVPTPDQPVIPPPTRPRSYSPSPMPASAPRPSPSVAPTPTPPKPAATQPQVRGKPTLRKEDIVPSWERARYDLPSGDARSPRRGDWFSRFTLLFSALAILSIVVLVILLVPILLNSRPGGQTPRPTQTANGSPTASPSATPAPTPQSTWLTYTIKLGDSLYGIAGDFGITYEQLLAANPQITNPNFIRAGDVINIPPPEFVPPSPSGGPTASASASP
jgi:LysM repeat protein